MTRPASTQLLRPGASRRVARSRASTAIALSALLVLGACGGSDDEPTASNRAVASAPPVEGAMTLAEFAQSTHQPGSASTGQLTPAELDALFFRSRDAAVAGVSAPDGGWHYDRLYLPALEVSFASTLAPAARGETLAEIQRQHPGPTNAAVEAAMTESVRRTVIAVDGWRFTPEFLAATRGSGSWSAQVLSGWNDPRFAQAGNVAHTLAKRTDLTAMTRLVVVDEVQWTYPWTQAQVRDGVFEGAIGYPQIVPMVFVPGARRIRGMDFVAHVLPVGDGLVMTLQPNARNFSNFRPRLPSALSETVRAYATSAASLPVADLVLPTGRQRVWGQSHGQERGLTLAFDEVKADLRGLDGGGTYLITQYAAEQLDITARGMVVGGGYAMAFKGSVRNRYYDGGPTYYETGEVMYFPYSSVVLCPSTEPDLKSFYLATMDRRGQMQAFAYITDLEGADCVYSVTWQPG